MFGAVGRRKIGWDDWDAWEVWDGWCNRGPPAPECLGALQSPKKRCVLAEGPARVDTHVTRN